LLRKIGLFKLVSCPKCAWFFLPVAAVLQFFLKIAGDFLPNPDDSDLANQATQPPATRQSRPEPCQI